MGVNPEIPVPKFKTMKYYYRKEMQKDFPEPRALIMTNKNQKQQEEFKGFTLVWEGKPIDFIPVIKQWASINQDSIKLVTPANPSNVAMWVANECIDWRHYRKTDEFVPDSEQIYRSTENVNARRKMAEYFGKQQQKADEAKNFFRTGGIVPKETTVNPGRFIAEYRDAFADD
jgi:hypothetical protein